MGELSRLGGEFRSLADDLIRQQDDEPLRRALVETMQLTLDAWQQGTGKGKIVLAEKSKLWRVYMDRSSPQTRTLDKYLSLDTLPKSPRWKTVVATTSMCWATARSMTTSASSCSTAPRPCVNSPTASRDTVP